MSNEIVPAANPDDDDQHDGHGEHQNGDDAQSKGKRSADENGIASPNDCRRGLSRLPSLTALKILTPAQSNAITRTFQVLLTESRTTPSVDSALPAGENILQSLRAQPELLEWLAPLLSDEDVARVMRGVKDDSQSEI